jgi:hyperosmotically inducible periplasmic protein
MLTRLIVAIMVVLGLGSQALAQGRENLQIFRDVSSQVLRYTQFTIFDSVHANVDNGTVTLTGKVTMPYKRTDLEKRVGRVAGVREVRNEIEVLPVSIYDDELRYRIARAIYGNSAFWNYAAMANPPIHVIVERGQVTLEGVVNNNVERMLARSIAGSFLAFSVTNNLKTDAEVQAELERMD